MPPAKSLDCIWTPSSPCSHRLFVNRRIVRGRGSWHCLSPRSVPSTVGGQAGRREESKQIDRRRPGRARHRHRLAHRWDSDMLRGLDQVGGQAVCVVVERQPQALDMVLPLSRLLSLQETTCCVGLGRCWPLACLARGCSPALSPSKALCALGENEEALVAWESINNVHVV